MAAQLWEPEGLLSPIPFPVGGVVLADIKQLESIDFYHASNEPVSLVDACNPKVSASPHRSQAQRCWHGIGEKPTDCLIHICLLGLGELPISPHKAFGN